MSAQVDRMEKITSQLVGDIGRLEGVSLDKGGEAQLVQLLTDAFETVGHVALDAEQAGDYQPCRCGEYETCPTCIEAHRQFRNTKGQLFHFAGGAANLIGDD